MLGDGGWRWRWAGCGWDVEDKGEGDGEWWVAIEVGVEHGSEGWG